MKKNKTIAIIFLLIVLGFSCSYERISMPDSSGSNIIYNTGEKRYIQVNPEWGGSEWNFSNPTDMFISVDGYIFIADSGNSRVVVMAKSGDIITSDDFGNDFSDLQSIPRADESAPINPVGLWIDSKLNLFVVDNSKNVYVWNQYINNVRNSYPDGADSIATSVTYINYDTNDEIVLTPSEFYLSVIYEENGYTLKDAKFVYDEAELDSIYKPHIFYTEQLEGKAEFVSVAAAPYGDEELYVCDRLNQRIASLYIGRSSYIKMRNGNTLWQHRGYYYYNVASAGTGVGTVNDPKGITVDESGNIYYTQTGENFSFHKISYASSSGWGASFALDKNEIMDLYRFKRLFDVATDGDGNIFVVDNGANEVQVYDSDGEYIRKAGTRYVQTDTTLVDSVLIDGILTAVENDTIIAHEYSDVLLSPKSVAVDDDDVIYIIDSGHNRILRYQLSTGLDIDLEDELGR
jgi:hypothetical protein